MGCVASKADSKALSSPGISVISGQQSPTRSVLKLRQLEAKECSKLGISPDSMEVTSRGRRLYVIARLSQKAERHSRRSNGPARDAFRQQEIRDAKGTRVLCLFARDWGSNITSCSCYAPSPNGSNTLKRLFTVKRGDKNNFWAEITNPIEPARKTRPFLDVPLDGGDVKYGEYHVASFTDHKLVVEANMDQAVIVALAMMTTAIKTLGLYTKMLMYASPAGEPPGTASTFVTNEVDDDFGRPHRSNHGKWGSTDSGYSSRNSSRSHNGLRNASQSSLNSRKGRGDERSISEGR